jgi:hypothetical protein
MFGANLVSVQKLLGHSDPKITERKYGHLLPDFMKSEVDRLRFGLDRLVPKLPVNAAGERRVAEIRRSSQRLARALVRRWYGRPQAPKKKPGPPRLSPWKSRLLYWRGVRDSKPLGRSGATCRRGTPFVTKALRLSGFEVSGSSTSGRVSPRRSAQVLETIWRRSRRATAPYTWRATRKETSR